MLLYKDIGSDSVNSYYPDFVHLSNYIRSQGFPSWSFCVGMGQDLAYATGYLIWQPVSWLPSSSIAPALGLSASGQGSHRRIAFFSAFSSFAAFVRPLRSWGRSCFLSRPTCASAVAGIPLPMKWFVSPRSCLATEEAVQQGRWLFLGFGGRAGRNDNAIPPLSLRLVSRHLTSR